MSDIMGPTYRFFIGNVIRLVEENDARVQGHDRHDHQRWLELHES